MIYNFICGNCQNEKILEISLGHDLPKVLCSRCGKRMQQNYKLKVSSIDINIPEDFKAGSEFKSKDYSKNSTPLENMDVSLNF